MTTVSNSRSSRSLQGRGIPGWMRSISLRGVGIMMLILALLFTIVSYTLHAMLNYPVILLDKPSFVKPLLAQGEIAALLGFLLNILALLGGSFWLFWLFLLGFRLILRGEESVGTVQAQSGKPNGRRRLLRTAVGLAVGLAGVAFVGACTGLTVINRTWKAMMFLLNQAF